MVYIGSFFDKSPFVFSWIFLFDENITELGDGVSRGNQGLQVFKILEVVCCQRRPNRTILYARQQNIPLHYAIPCHQHDIHDTYKVKQNHLISSLYSLSKYNNDKFYATHHYSVKLHRHFYSLVIIASANHPKERIYKINYC